MSLGKYFESCKFVDFCLISNFILLIVSNLYALNFFHFLHCLYSKGVGSCDYEEETTEFYQTRLTETVVDYIDTDNCTSPPYGYPTGSITENMMCALPLEGNGTSKNTLVSSLSCFQDDILYPIETC